MDTSTLLVVGGIAFIAVLSVVFVLNRSWGGNMPRQAGQLPSYQEPPRQSSWEQSGWSQPASWDAPPPSQPPAAPVAAGQAEAPASNWAPRPGQEPVLITHPMVRQAAENALQRGGPGSQYVLRQGNDVYFTFEAIPDAMQREMAYNMLRRFQAGENVSLVDMIGLMRDLFRK